MNILIVTQPDDTHALYVQMALESKGYQGSLWYTGDYPTQQTHSFELKDKQFFWSTNAFDDRIKYDVIWYRRPAHPVLPGFLHPEDEKNAKKENVVFFQGFWQMLGVNARWVNPLNSVTRVNSKLLQLKVAAKLGLKIPKTLISNDPDKIRHFIQARPRNTVIYKTLYPLAWIGKEEMRLSYTNIINFEDLPSRQLLQSVPGIFQEKINKSYELRVTYFGRRYIAVKINSQKHSYGQIDWRHIPTAALDLEEVKLPEQIDAGCQALMNEFNIVFGCFDFIVTPQQEYYFLEVNEQGQFLWIEAVNPKIQILNAFSDFLTSNKSSNSVTMNEFDSRVQQIQTKAMLSHKGSVLLH